MVIKDAKTQTQYAIVHYRRYRILTCFLLIFDLHLYCEPVVKYVTITSGGILDINLERVFHSIKFWVLMGWIWAWCLQPGVTPMKDITENNKVPLVYFELLWSNGTKTFKPKPWLNRFSQLADGVKEVDLKPKMMTETETREQKLLDNEKKIKKDTFWALGSFAVHRITTIANSQMLSLPVDCWLRPQSSFYADGDSFSDLQETFNFHLKFIPWVPNLTGNKQWIPNFRRAKFLTVKKKKNLCKISETRSLLRFRRVSWADFELSRPILSWERRKTEQISHRMTFLNRSCTRVSRADGGGGPYVLT